MNIPVKVLSLAWSMLSWCILCFSVDLSQVVSNADKEVPNPVLFANLISRCREALIPFEVALQSVFLVTGDTYAVVLPRVEDKLFSGQRPATGQS